MQNILRILNTLPIRAMRFWAFSPCIIGGTSTIQASLIVFGLYDNSAHPTFITYSLLPIT